MPESDKSTTAEASSEQSQRNDAKLPRAPTPPRQEDLLKRRDVLADAIKEGKLLAKGEPESRYYAVEEDAKGEVDGEAAPEEKASSSSSSSKSKSK